MNALLTALALGISLGISFFVPTYGAPAVLAGAVFTACVGYFVYQIEIDRRFLLQIFGAAILIRMVIGTIIFVLGIQSFFGGDAGTYDELGYQLLQIWQGDPYRLDKFNPGMGWGMPYFIAIVYSVVGRNMLAIQFISAVIGAATAVVIYLCAHHLFQNLRVARLAAVFVAFYPSIVLWSSQGLKDGPVVFLIAFSMLAALKLGERFSVKYVMALVGALFGIFSLRFYLFYMVAAAVGSAFVAGTRALTSQSLIRQSAIIISLGLALGYIGVLRSAKEQAETYGRLERIQVSRLDLAQSAQSGFSHDADVSTVSGAISVIPVGALYLLFAPFPWDYDVTNLRQSITLPEMIVWWAAFPLFVLGGWFTLKHRLRQALPILLFTGMLTISYSVLQGNVGTAYRQRAQLLVFFFIFVAVGFVLLKERAEDKQQRAIAANRRAMGTRRPSQVS